ncbi:hypothetical protein H5410_045727 [Solanum commersonii]|uniref:Uncharacterized protein n=1 Tax=Solanum commersonii TaxID=4109 RepID=A0A9J5XCF1_SOLCO|nr:hypothetical protein H5410_045727 [Solanum commersonii]
MEPISDENDKYDKENPTFVLTTLMIMCRDLRNAPNRHDGIGMIPQLQSLSIFNQPAGFKEPHTAQTYEKEKKSAELHVLLNCP